MTDKEIAQLIDKEFNEKTLGVTESYLDIHQPIYDNNQLVIDRIDRENPESIIAYLPVKDEYFFFALYIDKALKKIVSVRTESRNLVSLISTSEILSSSELQTFTSLKATETWDKGDLRSNKRSKYTFSGIEFIPNPEPDTMEDKLTKLLILLQQDKKGIKTLASNSNTWVRIIMDFHHGNQHLGDAFLSKENIELLNELKLDVRFEITAWGEPFK